MIVNNWPGFFSTPATLFGSHQPLCMWRTQKPSLTTLGDLYISATIFLRFLLQLCHELCNLSWLYTCHLPCHVAPCKCWTVCSALQVICLTTYFYFINLFIYLFCFYNNKIYKILLLASLMILTLGDHSFSMVLLK